jgi:small-conductance mechanosensitive channel
MKKPRTEFDGAAGRNGAARMRPAQSRSGLMTGVLLIFLLSRGLFAQVPVLRGGSLGTEATATADNHPDLVVVFNRPIVVLRSSLYGYTPVDRVRGIEKRISELIAQGKTKELTTRQTSEGTRIELDGNLVMTITPGDVDPLSGETLEAVVQKTLQQMRIALDSMQEQRSLHFLVRASVKTLIATLIYVAFIWAARRSQIWLWTLVGHGRKVISKTLGHSGSTMLPQLQVVYQWAVRVIYWILVLFATDSWFTYCLHQFPYTAPWGEALGGYLISMLRTLGQSVIVALPDVLVAVVIFVVTRLITKLVRMFFANVRERRIHVTWLDPDNARPTGRIVTFIIWAFALVMMYPYLPGSGSAAFKGVGVFVGLLVSLGGTGLVSQVMGGFVLMYTRSLKVGEYVHVGEHEGTVEAIGFMSTRLRTRKNEVINIPNAVLMGITTTNYSRLAEKQGVMASTTVTIGYDAPWRQVHAMLLRAAEKTTGIKKPPEPFVWQRALSDFYVEYELNVSLEDPQQRIPVLSDLCANIQDEFNEHGVQILSPHFMMNPPEKVWVPKKKWHEHPASQEDRE